MDTNFRTLGNEELINCNKTAFLCSHKVPDETFSAIKQWTNSLSRNDCVICGCLSGIERYVLKLLVERKVKIILAWSESMPENVEEISLKLPDIILSQSMGEGNLLIVSPIFSNEIHGTSGMTADVRNRMMIEMADKIVVGYCIPRGKVHQQLYGINNVTYLISEDGKSTDDTKNATSMGWAIYKTLKEQYKTAGSIESRRMLLDYLKLNASTPSILHTNILLLAIKIYESYPDFNFPVFLKMWGIDNFQKEDWKVRELNGKSIPSVVSKVITTLKKCNDTEIWPDLKRKLERQEL